MGRKLWQGVSTEQEGCALGGAPSVRHLVTLLDGVLLPIRVQAQRVRFSARLIEQHAKPASKPGGPGDEGRLAWEERGDGMRTVVGLRGPSPSL